MRSGSICEGWEGRTVDGKFPLLEWLGGWADQCVFLTARQGMQTANIKLVLASGADADAYLAKWEAARTLSHPHLVQVMESGRCTIDEKQLTYVVTERAETVLSSIIPHRTLDPSEMKSILEPIVGALSFVHEKGFVHGRLKPSNIVQTSGVWKLSVEELIGTGEIPKPGGESGIYDAPETADGNYSPASDVWSLGMILVEAFAHRSPESAANKDRMVPDSLPEPFLEIAHRCVRTNPAERCSIEEVKALLADHESQPTVPEFAPQTRAADVPEPEQVQSEQKQEAAQPVPEPALPFDETEPIELTPRSRLFATLEEEEDEPRSRAGAIWFGAIIVLGIVAVLGVRAYRIKILSVGNVLNPPAASQPSAQTQATSNASGTQSQTPAEQIESQNQLPGQTQSAPAANLASGQQQAPQPAPTASQSKEPPGQAGTQTQVHSQAADTSAASQSPPGGRAPAASAQASSEERQGLNQPETTEAKTAPAANTSGAVLKRVLPNVSPGASEGMRGPVEVEVRVWVNEHGAVSNAEYVTYGPGNYFARIAREATRSWQFRPPEREGQPRASVWNLRFRFERRNTEVTATELR